MPTSQRFDSKDPSEAVVLTFDFTLGLLGSEILTGPPTVTIRTVVGTDNNPTVIQNGSLSIDGTGKLVFVPVSAGLDGCDYDLVVIVPTSNAKKILALGGILPVRAQ